MNAFEDDDLEADAIDDDEEADAEGPAWPISRGSDKLQRLVDLLASLLVRRMPAKFDDLARDVPQYAAAGSEEALERMFERDKDELRRFGIHIETEKIDGELVGYRLDTKSFYLPFLVLASAPGRRTRLKAPAGLGYQSLETITFSSDELAVIAEAGARARALGDPVLVLEADTALRKLALDLPLDASLAAPAPAERPVVVKGKLPEAKVFQQLSDALVRRKRVTFEYYTIERDARSVRTVEPYGLFFVSGHWYLAARDVERGALRNFRLSRMRELEVNAKRANSEDFTVDPAFDLREHARSREPWEIGDGDTTPAEVEFHVRTGAVEAALQLGDAIEGQPARRRFAVRRLDAFARWLLAFGGDATPVAPPELVAMYRDAARQTRARYGSTGARA